jgi:hypothetical protein
MGEHHHLVVVVAVADVVCLFVCLLGPSSGIAFLFSLLLLLLLLFVCLLGPSSGIAFPFTNEKINDYECRGRYKKNKIIDPFCGEIKSIVRREYTFTQ